MSAMATAATATRTRQKVHSFIFGVSWCTNQNPSEASAGLYNGAVDGEESKSQNGGPVGWFSSMFGVSDPHKLTLEPARVKLSRTVYSGVTCSIRVVDSRILI